MYPLKEKSVFALVSLDIAKTNLNVYLYLGYSVMALKMLLGLK
jgi:hypothetical protein